MMLSIVYDVVIWNASINLDKVSDSWISFIYDQTLNLIVFDLKFDHPFKVKVP